MLDQKRSSRSLVNIVGIPLILCSIYSIESFQLLILIILLFCSYEYVRLANNFDVKKEYWPGDKVDTISFYFPNSDVHQKNEVVIESGTIESMFKFDSGSMSYDVEFADVSSKITSFHHLRPNVSA